METARHIDVRGWGLEKLHPRRKCSEPKELSVYACTVVSFVSLLHSCLWRDVWNAVSSIYYHVLHNVEEDSPHEPANGTHLFCAQHVFVPRIQEDLDTFTDGWNTHSLGMEHYLTSNQLWEMGMIQSPVSLLKEKKIVLPSGFIHRCAVTGISWHMIPSEFFLLSWYCSNLVTFYMAHDNVYMLFYFLSNPIYSPVARLGLKNSQTLRVLRFSNLAFTPPDGQRKKKSCQGLDVSKDYKVI